MAKQALKKSFFFEQNLNLKNNPVRYTAKVELENVVRGPCRNNCHPPPFLPERRRSSNSWAGCLFSLEYPPWRLNDFSKCCTRKAKKNAIPERCLKVAFTAFVEVEWLFEMLHTEGKEKFNPREMPQSSVYGVRGGWMTFRNAAHGRQRKIQSPRDASK